MPQFGVPVSSPKPTPQYYIFDARKVQVELHGVPQRLALIQRYGVRKPAWFNVQSDYCTAAQYYLERGYYREVDKILRVLRANLFEAENSVKQKLRAGRSACRSHRGTKVSYIKY